MQQVYLIASGYIIGACIIAHAFYSFMRRPIPEKSGVFKAPWRPLESITITVAIYIISSIVAAVLLYEGFAEIFPSYAQDESSTLLNFIYLLFFEGITLVFLATFLHLRKVGFASLGFIRPTWRDVTYAAGGFMAYFATLLIAEQTIPWVDFDQKQELGFTTAITGIGLVVVFFSLVILVPIVEELITRGFLYSGLRSGLGVLPAATITCLMFGLAHLQPETGNPLLWAAAIDTFILSVVLVTLRERTKSLASPIMLHMLKNAIAFIFLFIIRV
jgi:membrane protease YdiL (CAAX protease family)